MSREKASAAQQVQELLAGLLAAHEHATQRVGQWQEALQGDGDSISDSVSTKMKVL